MKKSLKRILIICLIAYFGLFTLTSCAIEDVFPFLKNSENNGAASSTVYVVSTSTQSADDASADNTSSGVTTNATATSSATAASIITASVTSSATSSTASTGTASSTATASATTTPTASATATGTASATSTPTASATATGTPSATASAVGNVAFSYLGDDYGEHVTSSEQFAAFFQYAALYKIDEMDLYLDFLGPNPSNDAFGAAVDSAMATITIAHGFNLGATCLNGSQSLFRITFTNWVDYDPNVTTKTLNPDEYYTPIDNLTAVRSKPINKRANDFNAFKIDLLAKSAPVTTSEQLLFVVMNGVKPVPTADSIAETIYNRAKTALREIVDDTMTDVEKVLAISDWLSKNVTYDEYIIELGSGGASTSRYNAHFLEGPFIDNRAVCDGFSKAFVLMARIEGIEAIVIEGIAGGGGHAWNKVNLPKNDMPHWYVIDNTWNNSAMSADLNPLIVGEEDYELWTRVYMLLTDADIATTHTEDAGHIYPVATGGNPDVDVYASIVYGYDEDTTPLTLKITSDTELEKALKWAKAKLDTIDTESVKFAMLDMEVTYDYGENFASEVVRVNAASAVGLNISKVRFGTKMGKQYLLFLL